MKKCLIAAALTSCALLQGCALHAHRDSALTQSQLARVHEIARHAVEEEGIVGLSIAIAVGGEVVLAEGYGYADLERTRPATADTIYDIASTGKQFTAVAILRLFDDGALGLDDRIHDIVPATPTHFPNATIAELLNHTSGFVSGTLDELDPPAGLDRPRAGLEVLDDVELHQDHTEFALSETFQYCNSGYLLLGVAVEAVSGKAYPEYVRDRLLAPAGMRSATVYKRPDTPDMADSLHRSDEGVRRVPLIHMSVYAGQGSICSSVVDLLRWNSALERGAVMSKSALERFREPGLVHGCTETARMPYGMGQRLGEFFGHRKIGHTGTYEGGSAVLATYPDAEMTIAVATNTNGRGVPHARTIEGRVAAQLLGIELFSQPVPIRPIPEHVRNRIEGVYIDGNNRFEARVVDDALHVILNGNTVEQLRWTGDLNFRDTDNPAVREWFVMDGETAGWWIYEVDGLCMNVARRKCLQDDR